MSSNLIDIEELCHKCGKLVAIASFSGTQKRNKSAIYLCKNCASVKADWKRPPLDDLIIADIHFREGTANDKETAMLKQYGNPNNRSTRYGLLLSCHEARKKMESGDFKGSTAELLSIIKTIVK